MTPAAGRPEAATDPGPAAREGQRLRLYLAPGACSLAAHVALREAGFAPRLVRVDLATRRTEEGRDFTRINPKGYVPALVLEDGEVLSEVAAILFWTGQQRPGLVPGGALGPVRLVEMLTFIATELHKPFIRVFFPMDEADRAAARAAIGERLELLAAGLRGEHLLGGTFSTADAYLYVMLRWARMADLPVPPPLAALAERIAQRPAVAAALRAEGLA